MQKLLADYIIAVNKCRLSLCLIQRDTVPVTTLFPGQISHKVFKGHTVILTLKRVDTKTVSVGFDKKISTNLQHHHHWTLSVAHSPYWS